MTRWRGPIETVAGIQSDRVCGAGAEGGPEVHPLGPHQGQGAQLSPTVTTVTGHLLLKLISFYILVF